MLGNYFLSDDFYADRHPIALNGQLIYIPDLAIGRLLEKPGDIIGLIDSFLAAPETAAGKTWSPAMISFRIPRRETAWREKTPQRRGERELYDRENWTKSQLANTQLHAEPPYVIQSVNGHADHYREGIPEGGGGGSLSAKEIMDSSLDLNGGLVYTLGCHSGLNVTEESSPESTDLPEAFAAKRANS